MDDITASELPCHKLVSSLQTSQLASRAFFVTGVPPEWPLGLAAWMVEGVYGLRLARNRGKVDSDSGGGVADQLLANLRRR